MQDLRAPLSDDELDYLNDSLLERIPEDADPDMDVGILDLSELDGFFTAIVSGPNMIPPSQWLPVLWGEAEPEFEDEKAFERILSLLMRYMNSLSHYLMESQDEFEPVFNEREVDGKTYTIVEGWCFGYMRGVMIDLQSWLVEDEEYATIMGPILSFGTLEGLENLETLEESEAEGLRKLVGPAASWLHAYWLARRVEAAESPTSVRREEPKIGRNDPCPCGSGKKYKKCCLH
ncbi:MAG: UPF0149 family protein [Gammaproteobacteria bacterium]|jgi:uncharacterized protein